MLYYRRCRVHIPKPKEHRRSIAINLRYNIRKTFPSIILNSWSFIEIIQSTSVHLLLLFALVLPLPLLCQAFMVVIPLASRRGVVGRRPRLFWLLPSRYCPALVGAAAAFVAAVARPSLNLWRHLVVTANLRQITGASMLAARPCRPYWSRRVSVEDNILLNSPLTRFMVIKQEYPPSAVEDWPRIAYSFTSLDVSVLTTRVWICI
jgi:hypothetical protein